MQVSPDRRFAIGFAGTNLLRLDFAANGTIANSVVLLGSVNQGDAWFARNVALARVSPSKADVPAARYVFALGGHLWTMGADGAPSILRAGNTNSQTLRRFALAAPQWSPAGDRVLTVESLASGASAFQLIAVAIGRDGTLRRYTAPSSISPTVSWSPDATQFVVVGLPAPASDPSIIGSELSASLVTASSGTVGTTLPAREAYWTKAGIVLVSNGTVRAGDSARDEQSIDLWNAGQRKTVVAIAKIVSDPRSQAPAQTRGITQVTGLTASPDGAYAAVHLNFLGQSSAPGFVLIRVRDGAITDIRARESISDESWAPTGRYIGYTLTTGPFNAAPRQRAIVRDADTGEIVAEQDGRFAGWSPDGLWTYVARSEGLFARKLAGGDAVRFSPYGVVVAATKL
jgi:hypothetical protein